jgi:cellulose synthase/poly-beta-1,6-N-acetylglucosamine synthase-like glycosyltransferase
MKSVMPWVVLAYFVLLHGSYLLLNCLSLLMLRKKADEQVLDNLPQVYTGLEVPISVLVPVYNQAERVCDAVRALLNLRYSEFEVVVINDGSQDATLLNLQQEFALLPFPEAYRVRLPAGEMRCIWRSTRFPNLRVIDKQHGGMADALNAGINAARYPLLASVSANLFLQADSLQHMVKPFLDDTRTVVAGGTVRVADNCRIEHGLLAQVDLPQTWLGRLAVVEYLRSALFGRLGWSYLNAMLFAPGSFMLLHKETVVEAGGYRLASPVPGMELVLRLHRLARAKGQRYRVAFVPEPVCWRAAPLTLSGVRQQCQQQQTGLQDSLRQNRSLLFTRGAGAAGWLAFPFAMLFECLGPALELIGLGWMLYAFVTGDLSGAALAAFLFVALGLGILLSISGLLLEEISFHLYPKKRHLIWLALAMTLENIGYRQLIAFWRVLAWWRRA